MEWVETTGRTVEEAKDAALDKLGIDETDAEFEILEEPRLGLFGRVRAEARVRARVRPNRPRPKDARRDRPRRGRSAASGSGGSFPAPTDAGSPPPADGRTPIPTPIPDGAGAQDARPPKASSRPQGDQPARRPRTGAASFSEVAPKPEGAKMDQDVSLREQADVAREFLVGLLASFETDGTVDLREVDEDTMELEVEGDADVRLLIGPGGVTLTAVQEITRRVVQRRTGARNGRLLVDVSGYRRKRKAALERFVQGVAAEVRERGVAKALEPMHAADRKVVHDTVNDLDGVSTISEGEEPRRRVVISPS